MKARYQDDAERQARRLPWPPPAGGWLGLAAAALIFAGHFLYGALLAEPALIGVALSAALLLGALADPRLRSGLARLGGLTWPAIFFALVLAAGVLSLTPFAPGGPHPVWEYVGVSPGAATIDRSATILELIKLCGLACLFLAGAAVGTGDERAKWAIDVLILLAALYGLWAFFGYTTGFLIQTQRWRLEGALMSPNTAGTFFAALLIVTFGPLLRRLRGVRPNRALQSATFYWAALLIFIVCLFLTASRGAALATVAAGLAFAALMFFSGRLEFGRVTLGVLAGLLFVGLFLLVFGEPLLNRFVHVERDALSRGELFALHWRAFQAAPLMGYGLGTLDLVQRTLLDSMSVAQFWRIRATHNVYIQWLEEAGVIGAVPMFACIAAIVLITLRRGFRRSRMSAPLFALVAANVVFLVHGAMDFALQTPSMAMMWAYMLGLQFGLAKGSGR